MTDNMQVTSVHVNKLVKLAGYASVANLLSWLLMAIPGFVQSPLSWLALVTILVSTLLTLVAGIRGLVSKEKLDARGAGVCVIGIFIGVVNTLVICLVLVVIYGLAKAKIW